MTETTPEPTPAEPTPEPEAPTEIPAPPEEGFDYSGYTVTEQGGTDFRGRPSQTTWSIVRDADGVGLGAYASQEDVRALIQHDRDMLAAQATPTE